jgi:hypothetical protein
MAAPTNAARVKKVLANLEVAVDTVITVNRHFDSPELF